MCRISIWFELNYADQALNEEGRWQCFTALLGSRVIIAGRNEELANESIEDIKRTVKNSEVEFMKLDLASLASVRQFAKNLLESENTVT